jgi:hypothetical protein
MNSSFSAPAHCCLLNCPARALPTNMAVGWGNDSLPPCLFIKHSNHLPAASLTTENVLEILFWRNKWLTHWIAWEGSEFECTKSHNIERKTLHLLEATRQSISLLRATLPLLLYRVFGVPWLQPRHPCLVFAYVWKKQHINLNPCPLCLLKTANSAQFQTMCYITRHRWNCRAFTVPMCFKPSDPFVTEII